MTFEDVINQARAEGYLVCAAWEVQGLFCVSFVIRGTSEYAFGRGKDFADAARIGLNAVRILKLGQPKPLLRRI